MGPFYIHRECMSAKWRRLIYLLNLVCVLLEKRGRSWKFALYACFGLCGGRDIREPSIILNV